ncbi:hypothetical protein BX600DRAFT_513981 [Xylariales sp. PMI_506]|nr:hypothetical protein BX600DRAFT_513981 [Xylariales sp. PMI_506]
MKDNSHADLEWEYMVPFLTVLRSIILTNPAICLSDIYVAGHSLGASMASTLFSRAAAEGLPLRGFAAIAAGARPLNWVAVSQYEEFADLNPDDEQARAAAEKVRRQAEFLDSEEFTGEGKAGTIEEGGDGLLLAWSGRYWKSALAHDWVQDAVSAHRIPVHVLKRRSYSYADCNGAVEVKPKILFAIGGSDFQALPDKDYRLFVEAFEKEGRPDHVKFKLWEGVNHRVSKSKNRGHGNETDYAGRHIVDVGVIEDIRCWVLQ